MRKWQEELLSILAAKGFSKFQIEVYKTTLKIPFGWTMSYTRIARQIKCPRAVRAVANALAKNPLPLVIPCHRVIRKDGQPGGYKLGKRLKKRLLRLERQR
jgi:O-6-methylguanine DNA methyltransferase